MIISRIAREKSHNILSMYKIKHPPVNVEKIANLLGFKVVTFDFPETISGFIKIVEGKKIIVTNQNHPEVRRRFSISHELGHYLSGHDNFSHDQGTIIDKSKKYLDPHFREEKEADDFAAELLMPEFMLKRDVLENKLDVTSLKKKYNVSEQAMWLQLINLKLAAEQSRVNPSA